MLYYCTVYYCNIVEPRLQRKRTAGFGASGENTSERPATTPNLTVFGVTKNRGHLNYTYAVL